MDNHWVEACPICDAPLKTHEFVAHFADCLKIEAQRTGRTDAEITAEIRERLAPATPTTPVPHSARPWGAPVAPVGKTLCPSCNGLTAMYPECGMCDARGWVD